MAWKKRIFPVLTMGALSLLGSVGACLHTPGSDEPSGNCDGVALTVGACTCRAGQMPVRAISECSAATMGSSDILCCQKPGDCYCFKVGCEDQGSGSCGCGIVDEGLASCSNTPCCNVTGKNAGQCRCGSECTTQDEVAVASCTPAILECSTGSTRVSKCTTQ